MEKDGIRLEKIKAKANKLTPQAKRDLIAYGKDITANCVGYNPSAFWAWGKAESLEPKLTIHFLSFEIVPDSLRGKKQYYNKDLFKVVDRLKLK